MADVRIKADGRSVSGTIKLTAGKSESNRVLLIRALTAGDFDIKNLASAKDTATMIELLSSDDSTKDVGPAGTTMRFLTAYYANTPGTFVMTGSERMKNRPIKILVDALRDLGAEIEYLEKEGCPPMQIKGRHLQGGKIAVDGSVSSQYLSALIMIAPCLEGGLEMELTGKIASVPYLTMTLNLIEHFGAKYTWEGRVIKIEPGKYEAKNYDVEADWSGASYWYQIAALSDDCELEILGLKEKSLQGDSAIVGLYEQLGVKSEFFDGGVKIRKQPNFELPASLDFDFSNCPDVAQTLASTVAGLGIGGHFKGLESLRIKETDRIAAIRIELAKFGIEVEEIGEDELKIIPGELRYGGESIETYDDHRVAMSIAPLCLKTEDAITIQESEVVVKSYPDYWKDLAVVGLRSRGI